ncbi:unnamed protein product [Amoebophrya sp. A25]|nr:unnamed protein product [Amoebophrya sp. A25]|eukprot:GSA25T00004387001.1
MDRVGIEMDRADEVESMKMAKPVLLEDSWEAEDVLEECRRVGIACVELTPAELENKSADEFVKESCFMCSTEIVQRQLRKFFHQAADLEEIGVVPCTYPAEFFSSSTSASSTSASAAASLAEEGENNLFNRKISKRMLSSLCAEHEELPLFVKPASNDKLFDGGVVRDAEDLARIWEQVRSASDGTGGRGGAAREVDHAPVGRDEERTNCEVYTAAVVRFVVEYRLFIGSGRLYGDAGKFYKIRAAREMEQKGDLPIPPAAFLEDILRCVGPERFWVVDVGMMMFTTEVGEDTSNTTKKWGVVEVNPPFSLDDHGLPIEPYCQYCQDACEWIRSLRTE